MVNRIGVLKIYLTMALLLLTVTMPYAIASNLTPQSNIQKSVQIAVTDIPKSFSPFASTALSEQYSHLFYDPLVRWGKERKIEYRLLEKYKVQSKNKTRFYLKKNIYFHSGNILTSKDVIWSIQESLKNEYLDKKLANSIKVQRINNYQFYIESPLSQEQILDYLTHVFILDSAFYIEKATDYDANQVAIRYPVKELPLSGTGPYKISSFYPDVNVQVEESLTYWSTKPALKKINFLKIKSIDSRLYALLANDVDISASVSNKYINSLQMSGNKEIYQTSSMNTLFLAVNEQNNTLLNTEVARNALHLSINQLGILKHVLNGTGVVEDNFQVANENPIMPEYDVTAAKNIFKKIDAPKQLTLLVMQDDSLYKDEVVFALVNMLKKVGISLKVTEASSIEQWKELESEHQLLLTMWRTRLIEEQNIYRDIFIASLLSDYLKLAFDKQHNNLTMDEKIQVFNDLQKSDKIIPLFSKNIIWAADNQFDLTNIFSVNGIPYWHLLTYRK